MSSFTAWHFLFNFTMSFLQFFHFILNYEKPLHI